MAGRVGDTSALAEASLMAGRVTVAAESNGALSERSESKGFLHNSGLGSRRGLAHGRPTHGSCRVEWCHDPLTLLRVTPSTVEG